VYLTTAPKRGNTADINDTIVAENKDKTLLICLFIVEIVIDVTKNMTTLNFLKVAVELEITDNIFPRINLVANVEVEVIA
jgi:cysteinyl-tRNA synthetase